jgi:hypothetical protein
MCIIYEKTVIMTEKEWNIYIETGFVPQYYIKEIVEGITSGKKLNVRHLQVYMTHGHIIEVYLHKKK